MKIIVCVKQVPDTAEIKIDPEKHTLIRNRVSSIMNPYDGYALEAAARIRDQYPDTEIWLLSMGPPQAEAVLRQGVAMAADHACLVSGKAFAGSDTIATSYVLSQAIRKIQQEEKIQFDMVFCGKQAIDGDTAQVGPEIAEHLGLPQITGALEASVAGDRLKVCRKTEEGVEMMGVFMPCLVTFTKPAYEPRVPTVKRKLAARKAEIFEIGDQDKCFVPEKIGHAGSRTIVKKTYVSGSDKSCVMIRETDPAFCIRKLQDYLMENQIYREHCPNGVADGNKE